jgi:hypothetical protein
LDSTTGFGGTNDWNSSVNALYGDQTGSPEEFGFPVFANCVQYLIIALESRICLDESGAAGIPKKLTPLNRY